MAGSQGGLLKDWLAESRLTISKFNYQLSPAATGDVATFLIITSTAERKACFPTFFVGNVIDKFVRTSGHADS